jgi:hypothetical protein
MSPNQTFTPRILIAGDYPIKTIPVTLLAGSVYKRGAVLGSITASGASDKERIFSIVNSGVNPADGTQYPKCVLSDDVDATGGNAPGIAYETGEFNEDLLSFGGNDTADTHRDALRALSIFMVKLAPV